ncbi:MAG: nitroreductase family protein [Bacteroidales bacterium]
MEDLNKIFAERRSIRRYQYDAIPAESMEMIFTAIRNTPSSYNGQQFSVIDIDSQDIKLQLYDIIQQKQIKTCNRFLVFCVDFNKINILAKAKGITEDATEFANTVDGAIVGMVDAAMAMQSAVLAAQAVGVGACCIGYARTANPKKIAEILGLPKGVFVVCGLSLGMPREMPDLKPKQSADLLIHKNGYRKDDMTADLVAYDQLITEYNATRAGGTSDNDWCAHMLDYYRIACGYDMKKYLSEQGLELK